jgi:6-phosphogluconolactonase
MPSRILEKAGTRVRVYRDHDELAVKAARRFARLADQYVLGCGRFTVVLAGGSTPKAMFTLLAKSPFVETVPWSSIYFFWGDERCVPPDHPDSNYRMTYESLLAQVPVPPENIFRIPAESPDPNLAAQVYSDTLINFFLKTIDPESTAPLSNVPRFDLILLGMGADAHTASLFPGTDALHNDTVIVTANYVAKFKAHRITLTAKTINNARNITFLVAGQDKAETLKTVLEGKPDTERYPSQMIHPAKGTLLWLVDEAAASLLGDD